ncbi:MAG: DUF1570 domain-containing protein, partial [Phycisphaerae bacterium]|nr:DUF1570 domain-containing protein [Phycisphaerae bacterium]
MLPPATSLRARLLAALGYGNRSVRERKPHLALSLTLGLAVATPAFGQVATPQLIADARRAAAAGRWTEAESLYRTVLREDPLNDGVIAALHQVTRNRPLRADSHVLRRTRGVLPPRFRAYETTRFIVLSDASPRWTQTQAERLERTFHQFHRYANRIGLRPLPLAHKLVCVLFADRHAYQQFAARHDGVQDPWIAGYYAPQNDRIVFYASDANPSVVEARSRIEQMQADLVSLAREASVARNRGQHEHAAVLRRHHDRYRDHVRREIVRVESFAEEVNIATTVHEAIHQLMFHTGVQTVEVQYPLWISEGLATAFETASTSQAFGPDHEHAARRATFDALWREGRMLTLGALVTTTEIANDDELVELLYHQSYALVSWMSRFRRAELQRYLNLMRSEPPGRLSAARHREVFERAFGP